MSVDKILDGEFGIQGETNTATTVPLEKLKISFNSTAPGIVTMTLTATFAPTLLNAHPIPDSQDPHVAWSVLSCDNSNVVNSGSENAMSMTTSFSGEATLLNFKSNDIITNSRKGKFGSAVTLPPVASDHSNENNHHKHH